MNSGPVIRAVLVAALALVTLPARGRGQGSTTQSCPDATDTPDILTYYLEVAYRRFQKDPAGELPPPCFLVAISRPTPRPVPTTGNQASRSLEIQRSFPESVFVHSLSLTEALLQRMGGDTSLLETRLLLLTRLRRFGEVGSAFDLLIARDTSLATLPRYKLGISAARRAADTAAMLRYLIAATTKFPTVSQLSTELSVVRQVPRLRLLIDSVHRAMKADPTLTLGYASLVSIYGNLDEPDSTLTYVKRGLAHRVPRQTLAASLRSLIGALLREGQISDSPDIWERTVPVAFDIDSAMSTPESKYLLALAISHAVEGRLDLANFYLPSLDVGHAYPPIETIDVTRVPTAANDSQCQSQASALKLLAHADERMTAGGNQFAPQTASAIVTALHGMRDQLTPFMVRCTPP